MLKIGPRLLKTGLAVALTIAAIRLTGHHYEVYGAVAAALAVAPSAAASRRQSLNLISAHLLGGLIGWLAILLFGTNPVVFGAAVIGVLLLCRQMGWNEMSASAITVTLFVMAPHTDTAGTYALWRLLAVVIGSLLGTAVNMLLWPPDYRPVTLRAILLAGGQLDAFLESVASKLDRPRTYAKSDVLAGVAAVEAHLREARRLFQLLSGQAGMTAEVAVLERAIKVLGSLLERAQVIHKAALAADCAPGYATEVPAMRSAMRSMINHRRDLYLRLADGEDSSELKDELLTLERRFEAPGQLPSSAEEVDTFFSLHEMRSSISYMANRLVRLQVAMAGARPAPGTAAQAEPALY